MAYRVIVSPAAQRQLGRLRGVALIALRGVILGLANEPRPPGAAKLAGRYNLWRIRLLIDGRPWRVVYQSDETEKTVIVTRIARRDEGTYRGL